MIQEISVVRKHRWSINVQIEDCEG